MNNQVRRFIDTTFGEQNEYVVIEQEKGFVLIDGAESRINISNFKTKNELVEKYIECRNTRNFFKSLIDSQAQEIDFLEKKLQQHKNKCGGKLC
ncbi:MAG: hypothetical protein RR144_01635 [Clostridia bacterium]